MKPFGLLAILALLLFSPAAAAQIPEFEFRDIGGTLACNTGKNPGEGTPPYIQCLRIGPVAIGQTLQDVARLLGKAYRVIENGDTTQRVYIIRIGTPAGQPAPYWVIGFDGDRRVVSIQMTGVRGDDKLAFSSIRLGDSKSRVAGILGAPYMRRDVEDIEAEFWGYTPFPISLEIKDGRVYSIRVSESAEK